ncbi:hypothetical protein ACR6C2_43585 [Streptomyces sp. INA 01156]
MRHAVPLSADRSAVQPPGRGPVDALISQTRRLRGDVDAVRRDTAADVSDPKDRWQRALYDLALHQLNDLDEHLAQLRDGPCPCQRCPVRAPAPPPHDSVLSRVGSAEWNLLTDEASWSGELYRILDRDPAAPRSPSTNCRPSCTTRTGRGSPRWSRAVSSTPGPSTGSSGCTVPTAASGRCT